MMDKKQEYENLIQLLLSASQEEEETILEEYSNEIDKDFIKHLEQKAKLNLRKNASTEQRLEGAKLYRILSYIHLTYKNFRLYEKQHRLISVAQQNRSLAVEHCNRALAEYDSQKHSKDWQICQNYLDIAFEKYVQSLRNYTGKILELSSTTKVIEKHSLKSLYLSTEELSNCAELPKQFIAGKVFAEILIFVARYSLPDKPPVSAREKSKWFKAQSHLYLLIQSLKLPFFKHQSAEEREQYKRDKEEVISKMIHRNRILVLTPLQGKSIGQSLTIFLKHKGRLAYWQLDYYRQKEREEAQLPTESIDRKRTTTSSEGEETKQNLAETIPFSKPTPWENLIENAPAKEFWNYLENDPDGLLKNCHVRKRPDCNCHILVQKRLFQYPPSTWQELATELNSNIGALSGRFNNNCLPLLREIAQKFDLNDR